MARHLVLDIDECLAHTFEESSSAKVLMRILSDPVLLHLRRRIYVVPDISGGYWGIKRPFLDEFLLYSFSKFETVSVWSAGKYDYVHNIVPKLFCNSRMPDLIMTKDDVFHHETGYCKPLARFYEKIGRGAGPHNTLFLDNRIENFVKDPQNGVCIPDFDPFPIIETLSTADDNLLRFMRFLSEIGAKDVRSIDKRRVFETGISHKNLMKQYGGYSLFREPIHQRNILIAS